MFTAWKNLVAFRSGISRTVTIQIVILIATTLLDISMHYDEGCLRHSVLTGWTLARTQLSLVGISVCKLDNMKIRNRILRRQI